MCRRRGGPRGVLPGTTRRSAERGGGAELSRAHHARISRPKGSAAYKPGHAGTAKAREEYYRACVAKALSQGAGSNSIQLKTAPSNEGKDHPHEEPH